MLIPPTGAFRLHQTVNVLLLGVQLDVDTLGDVLSTAFPERLIDPYTPRLGYKINFIVSDVTPKLAAFNELLSKSISNHHKAEAFLNLRAADVASSALERLIDEQLASGMAQAILIVNPSARQPYCYVYRETAQVDVNEDDLAPVSCSQDWVTKRGVLVVDLAAGPVTHGSIPREEVEEANHAGELLLAEVVNVVHSAVQHVLLPDVAWGGVIQAAQRVIVPVVVFQSGSIQLPHEEVLNQHVVRAEIEKLVNAQGHSPQGKREVEVVFRVVDVHQHKAIATVLAGARREESFLNRNREMKRKTFLDSSWILDRIVDAVKPVLISLLAPKVGTETAEAWVMEAVNEAAREELNSAIVEDVMKAEVGVRLIPVFILQETDGLLLDYDTRVVATSRHAVVIAHPTSSLEESTLNEFFISGGGVFQKVEPVGKSVTRHVVAGMGVALGGLVPPFADRHSADWRFAHGHQPFGPFSHTNTLNQLMLDTVRRNLVLSRLDVTIQICDQALQNIGNLAESELYDPHLLRELVLAKGSEAGEVVEAYTSWLHVLFEYPSVVNWTIPSIRTVIVELYQMTVDVAHRLQEVQTDLQAGEMQLAEDVALELLQEVTTFHLRVDELIDDTRRHLSCCHAP